MSDETTPLGEGGRRERSKRDKHGRIMDAAGELFAAHGVSRVTTQQVADLADVAVGTLYRYAATKAELLIMVQNQKFARAIDAGMQATSVLVGCGPVATVLALLDPVVTCVREQVENGRVYLHELVFGDPSEAQRREGLRHAARLEEAVAQLLRREGAAVMAPEAETLARVTTAVLHLSVTATPYLNRTDQEVLADIEMQLSSFLAPRARPAVVSPAG